MAFAIGSPEEQLELRARLLGRGSQVTEVRDRTYFQSIYFREPGGVLFEVATTAPGFAVDEPSDQLGRALNSRRGRSRIAARSRRHCRA